jgi:histidyl-tRNA synthetase
VTKSVQSIRTVKGTRDLLPPETFLWQRAEAQARRVFAAYNYGEIRTPILENAALFERSVGAETDIVMKEMYTFRDRDNELLTLRPEATASVVRAYIEHGLYNQGGIHKLFYVGPMFRRERPQKGRYRQFYQIGAEVLGSDHPSIDTEVLEMLALYLDGLGITGFTLMINSVGCPRCRPEYLRALRNALGPVKSQLCGDCQRRAETNPLRVLDCKVEADQPIINQLPTMLDHLDPECRQHFEAVKSELSARNIAYQANPRLVRGLDYYTRTTFEITSGGLGAQNAILGGGRYDGLSEMIGGPPTPGFGFSIGEDRLVLLMQEVAVSQGSAAVAGAPDVYVAWMGEPARAAAAQLTRDLRRRDLRVEMPYEMAKLKKSLGAASKSGARFTVIIGEGELASGRYQLKNMRSGEQRDVQPEAIADHVANLAGFV